jgi:hypothetical protein
LFLALRLQQEVKASPEPSLNAAHPIYFLTGILGDEKAQEKATFEEGL